MLLLLPPHEMLQQAAQASTHETHNRQASKQAHATLVYRALLCQNQQYKYKQHILRSVSSRHPPSTNAIEDVQGQHTVPSNSHQPASQQAGNSSRRWRCKPNAPTAACMVVLCVGCSNAVIAMHMMGGFYAPCYAPCYGCSFAPVRAHRTHQQRHDCAAPRHSQPTPVALMLRPWLSHG